MSSERMGIFSVSLTGGDMTASNLANAPPGMQKQMLGEKIFPSAQLHPQGNHG